MRDLTIEAQPYQGERHEKAWGHELWIINNEKYCGKLLVFKEGKQFSMHYHLLKDEAWYIAKGQFIYKWIDTETATEHEQIISEGDCVHLMPGQPHQMYALSEGATIFEVSTQHFNSDSYRVKLGTSQSTIDEPRDKVFYTKGRKKLDIRDWDSSLSAQEMLQRYGWEAAVANATLINNELNAQGPGIQPGDVVLDIGANIGLSSIRAELLGASKIYAIEPDLGVFEALEMNKADNWETFNIAIADYNGEIDIPKWPDWWDNVKRDCLTLERFFEENNIEYIDYMKVDIEGHEVQVLPSIPKSVYDKINKVFVEYHENTELPQEEKDNNRNNFITALVNKGYNNHHIVLGYHQSFIYLWK